MHVKPHLKPADITHMIQDLKRCLAGDPTSKRRQDLRTELDELEAAKDAQLRKIKHATFGPDESTWPPGDEWDV